MLTFTNSADVEEIQWDGEILWVETAGGLRTFDAAFQPIVPPGEPPVPAPFPRLAAPGPVLDRAWDGPAVRLAGLSRAWIYENGRYTELAIPASAAAPGAWGLIDGTVLTEDGVAGRVPGRVTALEPVPGGWAVGTDRGLWLLGEEGLRSLTPEGEICGNFVTGAAIYESELLGPVTVVGTFDDGACYFDGSTWVPIALPSKMVNDVVVFDGAAWLATSTGLVRWDGSSTQVFPVVESGAGTQHAAVTALAAGQRLWVLDVVGPNSAATLEEGGLRWRHHRYSVFGTSWQNAASCGDVAVFGSEDAGVAIWTGRSWRNLDARSGLPDDWVMAVACTEGLVYAGTYRDGTWAWDGRKWTEIHGIPDDWVLSMAADPEGRLYVGTYTGLFIVENGAVTQVQGLPGQEVHQITLAGDTLLVGTDAGLAIIPVAAAGSTSGTGW